MAEIDKLFTRLVEDGGSDLHLQEGRPPRYRIHGGVKDIEGEAILDKESIFVLTAVVTVTSPTQWMRHHVSAVTS